MGKIEGLIDEKIKEYKTQNMHNSSGLTLIDEVIADLQQLKSLLPTQQDKVVVPENIIEWFIDTLEDKEKFDGNDISQIIQGVIKVADGFGIWNGYNLDDEIVKYAKKNEENFLKLLVNCSKKDGYTVEKELLYYVVFNKLGHNHHDCYLWIDEPNNGYVYFSDKPTMGKNKFTEQEIKALDKRYWSFAVPVEEEAE